MLYAVDIPLHLSGNSLDASEIISAVPSLLPEILGLKLETLFPPNTLRPYTQGIYFSKRQQQYVWRVTALQDIGYTAIMKPLLAVRQVSYKEHAIALEEPKAVTSMTCQELADTIFQSDESLRGVDVTYLTPTVCKQETGYDILPRPRSIYNSLLTKWQLVGDGISLAQEGLDEELAQQCRLTKFHIDSRSFQVQSHGISGCVGTMRFRFSGNDMVRRLQGLLWTFAPFSGIGNKTALGMGAVQVRLW